MRKFFLAIFSAVLLTSCWDNTDPVFMESDVPSLTVDGKTVFEYNPNTCQLGYSPTKHEFRIHTDNMSDYFVIRMNREPSSEGENVKADLKWTSNSTEKKMTGVQFAVGKIGNDGTVWLWSHKEKVGVIVRKI